MANRYNSKTKLRGPFGQSEASMLDLSNPNMDDDTESIASSLGSIGRGQRITAALRGQRVRGVGTGYGRGTRGRSLH